MTSTGWANRYLKGMTLHKSTCIPAPKFNHRETEKPVPNRGTLVRLLLRTEQTRWSVVYDVSIVNPDGETGTDNSLAPGGTPTTEGSKPRATRWYRLVKNSNGSRRTAGSRSVP